MADEDCVPCIQADVRRTPVLAKVEELGAESQNQGGHVQQADRHRNKSGVVQNMQDPYMFQVSKFQTHDICPSLKLYIMSDISYKVCKK